MSAVPDTDEGTVRQPRVAGAFYPADAGTLGEMIDSFVASAELPKIEGKVVALFCPHAGYVYSGKTAACAYRSVKGLSFETVFVIAPSHHAYFDGVSVYDRGPYRTPLGTIEIDRKTIMALEGRNGFIRYVPQAHQEEHAVEVQLPFLQRVLGTFKLVPLVMGDQELSTCRRLGELLAETVGDSPVLVVASSDLYHGYNYDECRRVDDATLGAVEAFDVDALARGLARRSMMACGGGPIMAAMVYARERGADRVRLLCRTNSGDVTGERNGYIVGYGAGVMIDTDK